jgi:hypothetical protein
MTDQNGRTGLLVRATEKVYAPPFFMMGLNVENTTSEDFRVRLAARLLKFDAVGSGSELRVDGAVGADPALRSHCTNRLAKRGSSRVRLPSPRSEPSASLTTGPSLRSIRRGGSRQGLISE